MKKMITGLILSMAAAIAFALPAPAQIEAAIAARDYQTASAMTREVLAEKPSSARAHLLNGYVLLKQGNKQGALVEIENVKRLDNRDPATAVRGSALYGRMVAELEQPRIVAAPIARPVAYVQPQVVQVQESHTFRNVLIFLVVASLLIYLLYRWTREDEKAVVVQGYSPPYVAPSRNVSSFYGGPSFSEPVRTQQVIQQPSVVVHDNGMNNMVTGMMLGSMMSHNHHDHHSSGGGGYGYVAPVSAPAYVEPAPVVDSSPSSYSSGRDSSYDSSPSYSSSSDSSSSYSSSDSGSSGGWD